MEGFFRHLLEEFHLPLRNPILIFSTILFIILFSPILLRKLKVPAIIGLILSGVVIGPNGIGLIGEKLLESDGSVKLFSTIGLLYIMFIAGLELDLKQFKKYRTKSFTFGFFTFIIPIAIGYPVCRFGLGLSNTASILTASMFATHTLVAYPIISRLGISKSSVVALTVGGTILTDTAVLIILAVISGTVEGQLDGAFWVRLLTSLLIFSLIMFLVIPKIARWFFTKLDSEKSSQYIFVLSVVFFAAFLAEVAGVEHIIGAFVAGLALNKLIPHSSTLMNRIDFIGNALFIPFFLISVGMIVDYKVLFQGPWALIVAFTLTAVAIASKWLAAYVVQKIFKMTSPERQIIFGLSSAHAAATLAIIIVGYEKGIISNDIVNGTILLILITCLVASFVAENAGKNYLIHPSNSEDEFNWKKDVRNQHLLLAIDKLKDNELLVDFSFLITDKNHLNPISVVSVLPNSKEAERQIRTNRKEMDEIISHYSSSEIPVNVITTIDHNLSSGIARLSKELFTNLVILNDSKRINLLNRIVGDERDHLLEVCDKTIFFCQIDRAFVKYSKILVICPPFADLEYSFLDWSERIFRLTKELKIELVIYGRHEVHDAFAQAVQRLKTIVDMTFVHMDKTEDFFEIRDKQDIDELMVVIGSRPGAVSHYVGVETFITSMGREFGLNDQIVIYPSQMHEGNLFSEYDDFSATPLTKGMETIQKIGKEVGNIFKKGD